MAKTEFPNALEMEKKLLSALLQYGGEVIPQVAEILIADDFYRPEHKFIYQAILAVADTGVQIDIILVQRELERQNLMERIGLRYLLSLPDYEFTNVRAVAYAKEIKEKARLRKLIEISEVVSEEAKEGLKSSADILKQAEQQMLSVVDNGVQNTESLSNILVRTLDELNARAKNGGELNGISSGLVALDRVMGGLKKSDMIILAARPSMGKTALALNIAKNVAMNKTPTLIFSLEMSKEQLAQRLLSSESRVNASRINHATLTSGEWKAVINAVSWIGNSPLYIDDTAGQSLSEIRMRARRLVREKEIGLIAIDYIQLIQGSREYLGNRVQEVSEISRGIKALARELNVPILALSQLSRSVEIRADKRPQLSDLRESGSLEQDADIVMFLYREEYYERDNAENQSLAEVIVAKNRNGATGSANLQFEKEFVLFSDFLAKG